MKNRRFIAICISALLVGSIFFGFSKLDDRSFQVVKSLDVFNSVFKELDMFYVDTIDPQKVIRAGIDAMLEEIDPYTTYYPEEDMDEFKQQYFDLNKTFNPIRFKPDDWAKAAKDAGFKYFIFTTKHHDGFCMWDTKYTDYKVTSEDCPFIAEISRCSRKGSNRIFILDLRKHFFFDHAVLGNGNGLP